MIIKYKHEGNWGFIDGLSNVIFKTFSQDVQIKRFLTQAENKERISVNEENYPTHIKMHNELFTIVSEEVEEIEGFKTNTKCLLTINKLPTMEYDSNGITVIADLKDRSEYEKIALICNDEVYLMNDAGVTIERLN